MHRGEPAPAPQRLAANTTLTGGGVINDAGAINAGPGGGVITNLNNTIAASFKSSNGIGFPFNQSPAGTTFVNGAAGVVNSQALLEVGGQGTLSIVNDGVMKSTGFGYLDISNTNISGAGSIAVAGTGSAQITGGGRVEGQTFSVAGAHAA